VARLTDLDQYLKCWLTAIIIIVSAAASPLANPVMAAVAMSGRSGGHYLLAWLAIGPG